MKTDLNLAEDIIKEAIRRGATAAEVYMFASKGLSVEVKEQEIESLETAVDWGFSLRVLVSKQQGFSFSNEKNNWKSVVLSAIEAARYSQEDSFYEFAPPSEIPFVDVYDDRIPKISPDEAIEWAKQIEVETRRIDKRITKTRKSTLSFSETEVLLINSLGFNNSYKATAIDAQIVIAAEQDNEAQMGWGWMSGRSVNEININSIANEAAQRATQLLGAKKATTTKASIIMEASTVAELLGVLSVAFSADSVQKGKSIFAGKIGQRVASNAVDIEDSALLKWRTGSRPFDAEGVPSQRTPIVKNGVLSGYLYNLYTAKKDKVTSTSNAIRAGIYTPPSVGISNLLIKPSSDEYQKPLDELIGSIKKGMIVTEAMGIHTANPVTGEFSIGVSGLWIENGQISYPVREAAISGTLIEMLQKIVCFSTNTKFYGRIGCPDLLIEDINISG